MIIFNTTLHVDDSVHDECLEYLKTIYIPQSLKDNLIDSPALFKIESVHEEGGISYALQFRAQDMDILDQWVAAVGGALQHDMGQKFGNKVSGFATILEEIPLS